jgi:hypothetical protein
MKKADIVLDTKKYEILFFASLSEKDQRIFAALEAMKIGYNGVSIISEKYNINKHTIRAGQKELKSEKLTPSGEIRKKGGGRKKKSKKT